MTEEQYREELGVVLLGHFLTDWNELPFDAVMLRLRSFDTYDDDIDPWEVYQDWHPPFMAEQIDNLLDALTRVSH